MNPTPTASTAAVRGRDAMCALSARATSAMRASGPSMCSIGVGGSTLRRAPERAEMHARSSAPLRIDTASTRSFALTKFRALRAQPGATRVPSQSPHRPWLGVRDHADLRAALHAGADSKLALLRYATNGAILRGRSCRSREPRQKWGNFAGWRSSCSSSLRRRARAKAKMGQFCRGARAVRASRGARTVANGSGIELLRR